MFFCVYPRCGIVFRGQRRIDPFLDDPYLQAAILYFTINMNRIYFSVLTRYASQLEATPQIMTSRARSIFLIFQYQRLENNLLCCLSMS